MNTRPALHSFRVGAVVVVAALAAVGVAAVGVAAATGPELSPVELGTVQPATTSHRWSQFVATTSGALSVVAPQHATATVTSIQTHSTKATVSHGDTIVYVTLTADHNLYDHVVLIRLLAFGTTTTVGDLLVHMTT